MKIGFFQKLGVKLSLLPLCILLTVLFAGGLILYFFGQKYLFDDFSRFHLLPLLSEKKEAVDRVFGRRKEDLEYLSRNAALRDNIILLAAAQNYPQKKKRKNAKARAQAVVLRILEEAVASGNYMMATVLSPNREVIASTRPDRTGEDWSDRDFLKGEMSALTTPAVVGLYAFADSGYSIVSLAPFLDDSGVLSAILCVSSRVDTLMGSLRLKPAAYKTEQISLIDREGVVIARQDGIPPERIKYAIPADFPENAVKCSAGIVYAVQNLREAPFGVIVSVDDGEVSGQIMVAVIPYSIMVALIVCLMILQGTYFVPKFLTRPLIRLTGSVRAIAQGGFHRDMGEGYTGELLELKKACESLQGPSLSCKAGFAALQEFSLWELSREIEIQAGEYAQRKGTVVLVDCDDAFVNELAFNDKDLLKQIMTNLVHHSIDLSYEGMVTILISLLERDGTKYIEILTAGRPTNDDTMVPGGKDTSCHGESWELGVSKRFAAALGGTIHGESTRRRRSVINLTVPLRSGPPGYA